MIEKAAELASEIDDLLELAKGEQEEINWLIGLLAIPEDFLDGFCGTVFFGGDLMALDRATDQLGEYRGKFEKLCAAMPRVSPDCLRMVGLAQISIDLLFREFQAGKLDIGNGVRHLMNASRGIGGAIALLPSSVGYLSAKIQAERKTFLAKAGAKGGKIRNQPRQEIKDWAIAQTATMRGAHKEIARSLSRQLPKHFVGRSDDPERLIYDTLRKAAKRD